MKRAIISVGFSAALLCGLTAGAIAQTAPAFHLVKRVTRPGQANPTSLVHIVPTTMQAGSTSFQTGSDTWIARGFDVKTLISQIYDVDIRRVDLNQGGDTSDTNARYDLSVSLPSEISQEDMQRLLTDAIQKKFSVDIRSEVRSMSVYVMSAPNGPGSGLHPHAQPHAGGMAKLMSLELKSGGSDDEGQITYVGQECSGVASGGINASAETISDFSRTLEPNLDRVLIDETNLNGTYDFQIGRYASKDELFKQMQDQLGLVIQPLERKVSVVKVRAHGEFNSQVASMVPTT